MAHQTYLHDNFSLTFDRESFRRVVAGMDVVVHCHHYNSRIQRTIESAAAIDGTEIFVSTAEAVFARYLAPLLKDIDSSDRKWNAVSALYAYLGFGIIDTSKAAENQVYGLHSHFVEGWRAGFAAWHHPVCSMSRGFLQAAYALITGRPVYVVERACMLQGANQCEFIVDHDRTAPLETYSKSESYVPLRPVETPTHMSNIDEHKIIDAVVDMPIHGNEEGLIPAFNVYLANVPADFYNLVTIRFIEAMDREALGSVARMQLTNDAETCAMNTFRGIMSSAEWDALVAPMVRDKADNLFGVLAVSNALGWGKWSVAHHRPEETLTLVSRNGYEAMGYIGLRGYTDRPQCYMLTGVAAGLMELVYGEGVLEERFGQFRSKEKACICSSHQECEFEVERSI